MPRPCWFPLEHVLILSDREMLHIRERQRPHQSIRGEPRFGHGSVCLARPQARSQVPAAVSRPALERIVLRMLPNHYQTQMAVLPGHLGSRGVRLLRWSPVRSAASTSLATHAAGRRGYSVRSPTLPPFRADDEEIRP